MTSYRFHLVVASFLQICCVEASMSSCLDRVRVEQSGVNLIAADAIETRRLLEFSFFGFNLEWVEFQIGLWDSRLQQVRPEVVRTLQSFQGAVYRFPGGTKANGLVWSDTVGPVNARPMLPYVSWRPPLRSEFGLDEYLKFVRDVGGQAWYVANLFGGPKVPSSLAKLTADARGLASHTLERARSGDSPILRWELGNELDRGVYKWTPLQIAAAAKEVAAAIKEVDGSARFVHLQQEYPAMAEAGYSVRRFNQELRDALVGLNSEYAIHLYYDGVPENPPVGFFLNRLCDVVDASKSSGISTNVWITEHARVPDGFWNKSTNALWPETSNLAAAISVADMFIAASQVPEVRGAFVHSLVASGSPWPMFHKYSDGGLGPSATLLAMQILRQSMERRVVATRQYSSDRGSQDSKYSVRSSLLANDESNRFTLWSVNRTGQSQIVLLRIPGANLNIRPAGSLQLSHLDSGAGNHLGAGVLKIDSNVGKVSSDGVGSWRVLLPPNSVNAFMFR